MSAVLNRTHPTRNAPAALLQHASGAIYLVAPETHAPVEVPAKRSAKAGLTDTALKALKAQDKAYKVSDGKGMYVMVSPSGTKTFRFDYRLPGPDGKAIRETLTIGRYEADNKSRTQGELDALDYGVVISLADARALRDRASRQVKAGVSPSRAKVQQRAADADADTFGAWVQRYFDFKSDPKSGDEQLADSTLELRRSVYRRTLEQPLGKKTLKEIKAATATMQVASRIAEQANFFRTAGHNVLVAIDGGGVGGGVIDRLRAIGHEVDEVQFGARALDPRKYAQRRSELWGLLKEYLKVGAIPDDTELLDDLTGPEYGFNSTEAIQLEKKSDMKARGLSSPDIADALAITMAVTPPLPGEDDLPHGAYDERARLAVLDWNPIRAMERH